MLTGGGCYTPGWGYMVHLVLYMIEGPPPLQGVSAKRRDANFCRSTVFPLIYIIINNYISCIGTPWHACLARCLVLSIKRMPSLNDNKGCFKRPFMFVGNNKASLCYLRKTKRKV
jgi:hypothetical protein